MRRFRRVLPNILQGKTEVKKPCGKNPSGKPKKRERPALTKHINVVHYEESLGGVPGGEGVPAVGRLGGRREWS